MFTEDRDKWDVLVGALVVAIVIVGVFTIGSQRPPRVLPGPVATTPLAAPAAATPRVDMGHASVKRVSDPSIAVAYECTRDGQRILSDRPCGADAYCGVRRRRIAWTLRIRGRSIARCTSALSEAGGRRLPGRPQAHPECAIQSRHKSTPSMHECATRTGIGKASSSERGCES